MIILSLQLQLHQPAGSEGSSPSSATTSATTSRPHGGHSSSSSRQRRGPIGPLKPEQVAKMLSELDLVRKNIDIMNEIMTENEPGKESSEDFELLDVRVV